MSDPIWFILWCICGSIAIGLEVIALWRPSEGDTLSENLRTKVRRHKWIRWVTFIAWLIFSIWFAWHIWLT